MPDAPGGREAGSPHPQRLGAGAVAALRAAFFDIEAESRGQAPAAPGPGPAEAPDAAEDGIEASLGDVLDRMHERGFGLLLLLFALPCCIPFLYGVPQIMALPLLALAAQLAAGRDAPWLPERLRARRASLASLRGVVDRAERYVGWVERLARPRLPWITDAVGVRIVGALLLVPCASILVPLPSTNTAPGLGVAILSVGLMERDGLLVLAGLALGLVWVALLVLVGAEALSIAKNALLALF